jgi:hypothetical protein
MPTVFGGHLFKKFYYLNSILRMTLFSESHV